MSVQLHWAASCSGLLPPGSCLQRQPNVGEKRNYLPNCTLHVMPWLWGNSSQTFKDDMVLGSILFLNHFLERCKREHGQELGSENETQYGMDLRFVFLVLVFFFSWNVNLLKRRKMGGKRRKFTAVVMKSRKIECCILTERNNKVVCFWST